MLVLSENFDACWSSTLLPWFYEARHALLEGRPSIVVVPYQTTAQFLKERLLEAHLSTLGIHFWTPKQLRSFLWEHVGKTARIARRRDLQFWLSCVAEEQDNVFAEGCRRDTESFLNAWMELDASENTLDLDGFADIDNALRAALERQGLVTVAESQRQLTQIETRPIHRLLCYGFSEKNKEFLMLLIAGVRASTEAHLVFLKAFDDSAWERALGRFFGQPTLLEQRGPLRDFAESLYVKDAQPVERPPLLLCAENTQAEADIIVQTLFEKGVGRVGIVFPDKSLALTREVALRLERAGIPHSNTIGYAVTAVFAEKLKAWIRLQSEQTIDAWLHYAKTLNVPQAFEKELQKAYKHTFSERLDVLCSFAHVQISLIPGRDSFKRFWETAKKHLLVCALDADTLQMADAEAANLLETRLSRHHFLFWLEQQVFEKEKVRGEIGRKPFAHCFLISADEAVLQSWDTLILAHCNKGSWPNDSEPWGFLDNATIDSLNARSRREGRPYVISSGLDCERIDRSTFLSLCSLPQSLVITYAKKNNALDADSLSLSPFLSASKLTPQSRRLTFLRPSTSTTAFTHTTRTYSLDKPFNSFNVALSAKVWEEVFSRPSQVWFFSILKLPKPFTGVENWERMALGEWIHDWIALTPGIQSKPSHSDWLKSIETKALKRRSEVERAYAASRATLPEYWLWQWQESLQKVKKLAATLADTSFRSCASEYAIEGSVEGIPIRGRIDFLYGDLESNWDQADVTVVDFKTGSDAPLKLSQIECGTGLQLALYAFLLREKGVQRPSASILKPEGSLSPLPFTDRLSILDRMKAITLSGTLGPTPTENTEHELYPLCYRI
ncbi:MAG: hypothetical protein A2Y14_05605 [Verrucomicrobia bacterium GWF2_51_19]|nr:MAG: hypothetical protein A2Y14_05605 [Verrucomicrobia bacterium GWF2_51_19]HCJ12127.1 hypothetical protein [Opitutae bacterium]